MSPLLSSPLPLMTPPTPMMTARVITTIYDKDIAALILTRDASVASKNVYSSDDPCGHHGGGGQHGEGGHHVRWRHGIILLLLVILLTACNTQQAQQPDPRLKAFSVLSARIIMLDTQAEVDGTVQNIGHDRYPYDVTLTATFYDSAGNIIGQAQGVAEDVLSGQTRPFTLKGQVDSSKYSRMVVAPVSLRERRYEKNLPTPPPAVP